MNKEQHWLLEEKYHGEKTTDFYADCERLAAGEPLGYVIGHVPFLDCQIWLDSHPLIPRAETEFWVERALKIIRHTRSKKDLEHVRGLSSNLHILDLCAGSGAIGVAMAKAFPHAHVTFAELDPAHLPTIKKNLAYNLATANTSIDWSTYHALQSDLFAAVTGTFDFILSNPPYIDSEANTVDASVATHEPHLALFGGVKGMEVIERIIAEARAKLVPPSSSHSGGQLWLEHEPFQTDAIHTLAQRYDFTVTTHDDQYHTPRYSVLHVAQ